MVGLFFFSSLRLVAKHWTLFRAGFNYAHRAEPPSAASSTANLPKDTVSTNAPSQGQSTAVRSSVNGLGPDADSSRPASVLGRDHRPSDTPISSGGKQRRQFTLFVQNLPVPVSDAELKGFFGPHADKVRFSYVR